MNRIPVLIAVMALEILARDKIVDARKASNRKLDAAEAAKIYATIKDGEFIDELIQLYNGKDKLPKEDFNRLSVYGLDKELVERTAKSESMQKELLAKLQDKKTPPEMRHSTVRHFWKMRKKPKEVEGDEAMLRKLHDNAPEDLELRIETVKTISTTSDSNLAFLTGVARNATDQEEIHAAVNRLGKLGLKAGKEGRKEKEARIRKDLEALRESGRINLAELSMASNFSDTPEGKRYLKQELAKDGFRDWQEVLFAIGPDAGYENVRKGYRKAKTDKTLPQDEAVLKNLAKSNIGGFKEGQGLKDAEAKKDFLELRALMLDDASVPAADSALVNLLSDPDASVRMSAVVAAHYGLKDNHRILSSLLTTEQDESIRNFLQTYGYAE